MNDDEQLKQALERLNTQMEQPEIREWLSIGKEAGQKIDSQTAEITWRLAQTLDPYNVCPSFPEALYQIGLEYFARASKASAWVSFDDLSTITVDRLWERMRAGDFDRPDPAADRVGSVIPKPTLVAVANSHGLSPNKMLWQPTVGAVGAFEAANRVFVRSTTQSRGRLIVKDTDPDGSLFVLTILEGGVRLGGWIDVRTAKQFPSLTAHGVAAHFVHQSQLNKMDDLKQFLASGD